MKNFSKIDQVINGGMFLVHKKGNTNYYDGYSQITYTAFYAPNVLGEKIFFIRTKIYNKEHTDMRYYYEEDFEAGIKAIADLRSWRLY